MSASAAKSKLRTVADVISRLRWSSNDFDETDAIILGYDDRINGPMEKSLQDYKPIKDGGDIPEHRIWYVRTALPDTAVNTGILGDCVLWDRLGRVDRVFGSGNGAACSISPETLDHVSTAITTMARLDLEKRERRALKEKQRALKARKRANKAAAMNYLASKNESAPATNRILRYEWTPTPWYTYSNESQEWAEGCRDEVLSTLSMTVKPDREITVVTWNVLFDLYDNELADHEERWSLVGSILSRHNVDVIALQEATPAFVEILLSQSWVKECYAATASPFHTDTVKSSGNLLLWRKSLLQPLDGGVFVCVDSFRQCSVMACLESVEALAKDSQTPILIITNVHLLGNKSNNSQSSGSRALARQRELAAVIGQLQKVEQQVALTGRTAQPMIVGDFNTSDADGSVFGNERDKVFADVWALLKQSQPGYTFDPVTNVRAARTQLLTNSNGSSKRLDRMYLARRFTETLAEDNLLLRPVAAELIGHGDGTCGEAPPSDHYGLKASFQICRQNPGQSSKAILRHATFNAWAAYANPTPNTLLALVLDDTSVLDPNLFNEVSTLPVPHITLLHGFVELSCGSFRELAMQAICDAVNMVQGTSEEWKLCFTESSLDAFEHRASATLIARADIQHPTMKWVMQLYKALTTTFLQCREQESRFDDGWTPHVSLGTFGTTFAAREEASRRAQDGRWIQNETFVPVHGITMFERSTVDGNFYAVASVPFEKSTIKDCSVSIEPLLQDACASYASNFKGTCSGVLLEIHRACQAVVDDKVHTKLSVYGSHAMDAALPPFSDIDAVIEVTAVDDNMTAFLTEESGIRFLGDVASRIKVSTQCLLA